MQKLSARKALKQAFTCIGSSLNSKSEALRQATAAFGLDKHTAEIVSEGCSRKKRRGKKNTSRMTNGRRNAGYTIAVELVAGIHHCMVVTRAYSSEIGLSDVPSLPVCNIIRQQFSHVVEFKF